MDSKTKTDLKDYLIVSLMVFLVSSDWFDNWIRNMFPQLTNTNPLMYALIKTGTFAALYWAYHYFFLNRKPDLNNNNKPASTTGTGTTGGTGGN